MARKMPYRVTTSSGNQFDFEFPLHPATGDPVQVSQLLTALLAALDREIKLLGQVGNGDVLQALAMALAARGAMVPGTKPQIDTLARELVDSALGAEAKAADGNLPPEAPRALH